MMSLQGASTDPSPLAPHGLVLVLWEYALVAPIVASGKQECFLVGALHSAGS